MTIILTMDNGQQHEVDHGSRTNEEKWCIAYLKNADIIGADIKDEDYGGVQGGFTEE